MAAHNFLHILFFLKNLLVHPTPKKVEVLRRPPYQKYCSVIYLFKYITQYITQATQWSKRTMNFESDRPKLDFRAFLASSGKVFNLLELYLSHLHNNINCNYLTVSLYRLNVLERQRDKTLEVTIGFNKRDRKVLLNGKGKTEHWIHRIVQIHVHSAF